MIGSENSYETVVVDLTDTALAELRVLELALVEDAVRRFVAQIERPRANLGSSGPPGRVD